MTKLKALICSEWHGNLDVTDPIVQVLKQRKTYPGGQIIEGTIGLHNHGNTLDANIDRNHLYGSFACPFAPVDIHRSKYERTEYPLACTHSPPSLGNGTWQSSGHQRTYLGQNGVEVSLPVLSGGNSRCADLRFGQDRYGEVFIMAKQDGKIRRLERGELAENRPDDPSSCDIAGAEPLEAELAEAKQHPAHLRNPQPLWIITKINNLEKELQALSCPV